MSDKYVTFRIDDWDQFVKFLRHEDQTGFLLAGMPEPVPDAEVFRHQDLVSAPIFYNASSIYLSYIELADLMGQSLTEDQRAYLKVVADHFYEAAEKATGLPNRKLPD